jgi:hypothetical protein
MMRASILMIKSLISDILWCFPAIGHVTTTNGDLGGIGLHHTSSIGVSSTPSYMCS